MSAGWGCLSIFRPSCSQSDKAQPFPSSRCSRLELGASTAMAGAIVALRGIGSLLFDVPSGMLVAAFGERRTMAVGAVLLGVVALGVAMKPPLPVYCGLVLLMGVAWSIWSLARLNYATDASPNRHRGRVMSTMGGSGRVGQLLGPILGGLLTVQLGLSGPFFLQATLAIAACLALQLAPVPESFNPRSAQPSRRERWRPPTDEFSGPPDWQSSPSRY